jgi:integrase
MSIRIVSPTAVRRFDMVPSGRVPSTIPAGLALCTGVRCSELVALKWSDFDWQNLSAYIRRAIVYGRVDDVKTEYSEAPLPLDPALAEVIFEWSGGPSFPPTGLCVRFARHASIQTTLNAYGGGMTDSMREVH